MALTFTREQLTAASIPKPWDTVDTIVARISELSWRDIGYSAPNARWLVPNRDVFPLGRHTATLKDKVFWLCSRFLW